MSFPVTGPLNEWLKYAPPPRPLAPGENWNVFLSYRSVNRAWVFNLYDLLTQYGHKVFIETGLKPGDPLIDRLEDALQTSQAGILIWSNAAADSEWVRREYRVLETRATENRNFQFVPVVLDGSKLPGFAGTRVYLDFSSYPDGPNGGELLRLLHVIVGKPLSQEAKQFAFEQDEEAQIAAVKIGAAVRNGRPDRILQLVQENGLPWQTSSVLACKAAEGLVKLGQNSEAIELLERVRKQFPKAYRPMQLYGLVLARRGKGKDLDMAQEILGELYEKGERDPETLGIYARTWMDRYAISGKREDLRFSRDLYAEAFSRAPDDYYTGINAASKSVFLGSPQDLQEADKYAEKVQQLVGIEPRAGDYWLTATIAELLLIRRNYSEAARVYSAAVRMAPQETASHESTWKQACWLMQKLQPNPEDRLRIREAFGQLPDCEKWSGHL